MRLQIFIQGKYLKSVICLSVILIDSIFKKHELLSQVLLKEYKDIEKEGKIRYITDGLEVSSVYSGEFDEEQSKLNNGVFF